MKFVYDGKAYRLEFERKFGFVDIHRQVKNAAGEYEDKVSKVRSKYPFTTVKLLLLTAPPALPLVIAQAKVGCLPTDKFSNETGRIYALRSLTKILYNNLTKKVAKGLVTAIWQAYTKRGETAPKPAPQAPVALLPADTTLPVIDASIIGD